MLAIRPWRDTGAFSVRGDTVFFRSADGVGVYRWNVFRDTLTLRNPGQEDRCSESDLRAVASRG